MAKTGQFYLTINNLISMGAFDPGRIYDIQTKPPLPQEMHPINLPTQYSRYNFVAYSIPQGLRKGESMDTSNCSEMVWWRLLTDPFLNQPARH